jgi:hypothetical protein
MNDRCLKPRLLRLPKIEAARRQIESAIWLWFADADMVSVRTLTVAAHRLILELTELWGVTVFPFSGAYVASDFEEDRKSAKPDAESYFKNAKESETYELCEAWTELYLLDAVIAYTNLVDNHCGSALMSTFVLRLGVQRQELFAHGVFSLLEQSLSEYFNLERLQQLNKMEFLSDFLRDLNRPAA